MKFIQGHNRTQINLFPVSLEQSIDPDNEVRMIDLFVDSLSIKDYGFREDFVENGRPTYHLRVFQIQQGRRLVYLSGRTGSATNGSEYLRILASLFLTIFDLIRSISEVRDGILFPGIQMPVKMKLSLKPL